MPRKKYKFGQSQGLLRMGVTYLTTSLIQQDEGEPHHG